MDIIISKDEMDFINNLLCMNGEEIYEKYGLKRDETIVHTVKFSDNIEADIKLVICEDDTPYTEGVLFCNGREVQCTEPSDTYSGIWKFDYEGESYVVNVITQEKDINDLDEHDR